MSIVLYM